MLSAHGDRRYASLLFGIFIVVLTVLPFLILIYFYPLLPDRVPEYLKLNGEVEVWGRKGFMSVFRVPLMAIDLQVLCLLTKHAARQRTLVIDWLRTFIAIKLAASSLEVIFFSIERFHSLTIVTRTVSWTASVLGVAGAIFYGYRFYVQQRKLKLEDDPRPRETYVPNFGNVWTYVFIACLVCLPCLMFWPLLESWWRG